MIMSSPGYILNRKNKALEKNRVDKDFRYMCFQEEMKGINAFQTRY